MSIEITSLNSIDMYVAPNASAIPIVIPANIVDNEIRYALISKILTKCFVVIFTIREDTTRIISVRRCRKNEERNYENNNS